jgi:predicted GNAT family acetyltransferase
MELEIVLINSLTEGKLVASEENKNVGVLSYSIDDSSTVNIDGLEIEKGYEKKNIENELIDAIVELARNNRKIIVTKNSFAKLLLEMNDCYQDVLCVKKINQVIA